MYNDKDCEGRYQYRLLWACQTIQEHCNFSAECFSLAEIRKLVEFVRNRANNWKPSCRTGFQQSEYDEAVHKVCWATLGIYSASELSKD